jgi:CheY-like chemotaxis protein/sRNA-binding carbon storage regulator CsrA
MLVLSRSEQQKVLFPSLDISVEVLRVRGRVVSLGIQAPLDVPIQRAEIAGLKSLDFPPDSQSVGAQLAELKKTVRSGVLKASERLNELHQTFERLSQDDHSAELAEANRLLIGLFGDLSRLEDRVQSLGKPTPVPGEDAPQALLVEDDQNERELMAGFLRLSGFSVVTASDGRDALDYLSLHAKPDVILLDMQMPRCDGATMVRQIRRQSEFSGLKLIAVSGAERGQFNLPIGPEGVDRWFQKPVNPEKLVVEVQRELGLPAAAL